MFANLRQPCVCVCRCLLPKHQPGGALTSIRKYENPNTAVFERKHPIQNCAVRKFPLVKKRNYVYNKVEPVPGEYKTTMKCILTKEVEDIGLKGTLVEVPKRLFRNVLYPRGDAVYASPENKALYSKYRQQSHEEGIDYEIKQLMKSLAQFHLRVFMNAQEPWTLSVEHVKIAFRKMGVMLSEDNILMPKEPVSSVGDFVFKVQMNDRIAVQVRGTIYPLGNDNLPDPLTEYPPMWGNDLVDPNAPIEYLKQKNVNSQSDESLDAKETETTESLDASETETTESLDARETEATEPHKGSNDKNEENKDR